MALSIYYFEFLHFLLKSHLHTNTYTQTQETAFYSGYKILKMYRRPFQNVNYG